MDHHTSAVTANLRPKSGSSQRSWEAFIAAYRRSWRDPTPGMIQAADEARQYGAVIADRDAKRGERTDSARALTEAQRQARKAARQQPTRKRKRR